jgi:hypothetical protein
MGNTSFLPPAPRNLEALRNLPRVVSGALTNLAVIGLSPVRPPLMAVLIEQHETQSQTGRPAASVE